MPKSSRRPLFVTPEQVAENWNISVGTGYRLLRSNKLPGYKLGHDWRIRQRDVVTLATAHRRKSKKATAQDKSRPSTPPTNDPGSDGDPQDDS